MCAAEKKAALRGELESELAALSQEGDIEKLRKEFSARERKIEHQIDSKASETIRPTHE